MVKTKAPRGMPGRLDALKVSRLKKPGLYADGAGLYLQVTHAGARSWIFRYRCGRAAKRAARDMGLGSLSTITLAEAREAAREARKLILADIDPIEDRRVRVAKAALETAKLTTFEDAAERYIKAHKPGWRNLKHGEQWRSTLKTYAFPVIGRLPVQGVDVGLVLKVLEPIWTQKPETASRVRGRIESVLDWAAARKLRQGDNPARWQGLLKELLPSHKKVRRVVHHPALSYSEIGTFMAALKEQPGTAALALQFLILTGARTGEVIGARWAEIDMEAAVWTVPAERMKAGKEHKVPLSKPALAILKEMALIGGEYVFPGGKKAKPLSNGAILMLLRRMGRSDLTAHGFRSTLRDWISERTNYPREVAEMTLGHAIGNKVEAAYRRGELFEKRKRLMAEWAKYCGTVELAGKVVPIRKGRV